jgi:hypothetical protein
MDSVYHVLIVQHVLYWDVHHAQMTHPSIITSVSVQVPAHNSSMLEENVYVLSELT